MNKRSYLYLILLLLPLMLWRDFTPNNELRYLTIADEAIQNGSLFTFSYNEAIYADKPPLYLWVVMGCKWLLGYHAMWLLSLFSILPALLIVKVMDGWVAPMVSEKGRKAAGYALMTTGMFIGAGIVIRMDMLMTLFIVLALRRFYNIYKNNYTHWDKLLLPFYIFMGLFTKGPVGLLLPLLVMVLFLILKGELRLFFRKYMGFAGWFILLGLSALWIGAVALEGGKEYLENLLFKQTVGRAVEGFHHKEPWWYYPVNMWSVLIPWSLFYGMALGIGFFKRYIRHELEQLFAVVIVVTLVMLSFSASKLTIYLLPMIPFISYLSIILCRRIEHRWLYFTVAIPAIGMMLALPIAIGGWFLYLKRYVADIELTELPWAILLVLCTLSYFGLVTLIHLKHDKLYKGIKSMGVGLLVTVCVGSFSLDVLNPYLGFKQLAHNGQTLAHRYEIDRYGYYNFRAGNDMTVYLNEPIEKLTLEQIALRRERGDLILFLRNKDITRTPELYNMIEYQQQVNVGQYTIVIFPPRKGVMF